MNKLEYVWLSNLDISNENKFKFIKKFGSIKEFYHCSLDDLIDLEIQDDIAYKILNKNTKEKALRDLEYMEKNQIDIICFEEKLYPTKFKNLVDKPVCFYIKGNLKILNNESIGIVGSRLALKESLEISRLVANVFACKGINVISGLAKGIDKYAHLGALDATNLKSNQLSSTENNIGKTIGIVASGLDKKSFYPWENYKVYERMVNSGGAVISEYPIGTLPKPYFFPYRNRLISGLSDKIFVVQASSLKSGSMITVNYALDQGKEVYVYQSKNGCRSYFEGNKLLIEEGAKIFKIW